MGGFPEMWNDWKLQAFQNCRSRVKSFKNAFFKTQNVENTSMWMVKIHTFFK